MKKKNNDIMITPEDRELLRNFFINVLEWMLAHLNPTLKDIKEFTQMYEEYLNTNHLRNNKVLMLFLLELKYEQLKNQKQAIKFSSSPIPPNPANIQNGTIAKWYRESKLSRHLAGQEISHHIAK